MAATKKATTTKVTTVSAKAATQKIMPVPAPEVKTIKAAAPAPVAAKPVAAPAKPVAAAPAKPVVPAPAPVAVVRTTAKTISQGEWRSMVEQAAYYLAEKSGFAGNPEEHWAAAEAQIRAELAAKSIKVA